MQAICVTQRDDAEGLLAGEFLCCAARALYAVLAGVLLFWLPPQLCRQLWGRNLREGVLKGGSMQIVKTLFRIRRTCCIEAPSVLSDDGLQCHRCGPSCRYWAVSRAALGREHCRAVRDVAHNEKKSTVAPFGTTLDDGYLPSH